MTDKIVLSIPIHEFNQSGGTLRNCKPISKSLIEDTSKNTDNDEDKYKWRAVKEMYLLNPRGTHSLRVTKEERVGAKRLCIYGSVRKWLLGENSIEDITKREFPQFVEELAELLNLPIDIVWHKLKLSQTELGYNFLTKLRWNDFVKHCVQYGRTKDRLDYDDKNETLYWNGDDKILKMYDKGKEIPTNIRNKSRKNKAKKKMKKLADKGLFLCRIEVTYADKNSFKKYGQLEISTLYDLYENWHRLHYLLVREISKIRIDSKVHISEYMTPRQQAIAIIINKSKKFDTAVMHVAECFYNSDENKAKRKILAVMNEFSSPEKYSIRSFRKAIAKKLRRINREREELPLSDLYHILWRTTKGRTLYNKEELINLIYNLNCCNIDINANNKSCITDCLQ